MYKEDCTLTLYRQNENVGVPASHGVPLHGCSLSPPELKEIRHWPRPRARAAERQGGQEASRRGGEADGRADGRASMFLAHFGPCLSAPTQPYMEIDMKLHL